MLHMQPRLRMGELHLAAGAPADAEPLLERALRIWTRSVGPAHPAAGRTLSRLAEVHARQGDWAAAAPLRERALAILEASGADGAELAEALSAYAGVLRRLDRAAEADALEARAAGRRPRDGGGE